MALNRPSPSTRQHSSYLDWVAHKKNGRIVADHVPHAVLRVVLDRKAARVARRVCRALLAADRREARKDRRALANLGQKLGLAERRHVVRDLKVAVRARALGVHDALGDALAVEMSELVDQVKVLQQQRAVLADGCAAHAQDDGLNQEQA